MIWCLRLHFFLICRHTTFSWVIHPSCVKLSKWKSLWSQAIVSCLLLIPECIPTVFKAPTFQLPLLIIHPAPHIVSLYTHCHVILSLAHKAMKDWFRMGGCDQRVVRNIFPVLLSLLLITSASMSSAYAHLMQARIIGAKSSPRFNEAVLELVREWERLKQTPLCDVHISYLPLPRSLPFLNYLAGVTLSFFVCLFFFPSLYIFSLARAHTHKFYPTCSCFSPSSMSVQPALAEAVALSEMQMAAFEGEHRERQLIQAFTRLKEKRLCSHCSQAVSCPLCYRSMFLSTVLMPQDSADSSKIQETSGQAQRQGNDIGSWGSSSVRGIGCIAYSIISLFIPKPFLTQNLQFPSAAVL